MQGTFHYSRILTKGSITKNNYFCGKYDDPKSICIAIMLCQPNINGQLES